MPVVRFAVAWFALLAGLGVAAVSALAATAVSPPSTAVLLAALGGLAGGAIAGGAGIRLIDQLRQGTASEAQRLASQNADLTRRLADEQRRQGEARVAQRALEERIEGLKRMRIDVNHWEEVFKVGLLEFDGRFTHFQRQTLAETAPEPALLVATARGERVQYVGVREVSFRSLAGVDLDQVGVRVDGERLVVTGFGAPFQTFRDVQTTPLLSEVRRELTGGTRRDVVEVVTGHPRLAEALHEHDRLLEERLNTGADLAQVHAYLVRRAEGLVRRLLAPVGKPVTFIDTPDPAATPLRAFLRAHDAGVAAELGQLEQQRLTALDASPPLLGETDTPDDPDRGNR